VEDHSCLPRLVEVNAGPGNKIEEVVHPKPPQTGILEVVGGHEMPLATHRSDEQPSVGMVATIRQELEGEEGVCGPTFAEVDLDGI
jgi:hypothetical protein